MFGSSFAAARASTTCEPKIATAKAARVVMRRVRVLGRNRRQPESGEGVSVNMGTFLIVLCGDIADPAGGPSAAGIRNRSIASIWDLNRVVNSLPVTAATIAISNVRECGRNEWSL